MNKLLAVLKLTRIEHSLMLIVAVIAAELLTGGLPSPSVVVLSIITPIFISMGSFAVNDYFDINVDRLNKKDRPLVKGYISPDDALYISTLSFLVGIGASAFINIYALSIATAFALLAILYSYKLKEIFLLGNLYIALTMAIPFLFGDYVVSNTLNASIIVLSAMVFLSGLAREIHGTIRDYRGDTKVRGVNSLPKAIGQGKSALTALLLYLMAIAVSIYLFLAIAPFRLNIIFGAIVGVSDLMLLYVGIAYLYNRSTDFYKMSRNVSLLAMALALIAILVSALVHS